VDIAGNSTHGARDSRGDMNIIAEGKNWTRKSISSDSEGRTGRLREKEYTGKNIRRVSTRRAAFVTPWRMKKERKKGELKRSLREGVSKYIDLTARGNG